MKTNNTPTDAALREALRRIDEGLTLPAMDGTAAEQELSSSPASKVVAPSRTKKTARLLPPLRRIAAIFLAAAFLGGMAWAICGPLLTSPKGEEEPLSNFPQGGRTPLSLGGNREGAVLFADIRLDSMLTVVAQHYGKAVSFGNEQLKALRIHTKWNPQDSLAVFLENLNELDGLQLTEHRDTVFVQGETHPSPSL